MSELNIIKIAIRWSDLDANMHVRHSVYYDWTDFARMTFFAHIGLTLNIFYEHNLGPVIFREEGVFHREILPTDDVVIKIFLLKSTQNFRKWTILHEIWKNEETLAATIIVDGSWIDTKIRKVKAPDSLLVEMLHKIPQHRDFEMIATKEKKIT